MTFELPVPTTEPLDRPALHLAEEPPPENRPGRRWMVIAALVAVAAVLGTAIGVYGWQHGQVADSQAIAARLQVDLADRTRQISALNGRLLIQTQQLEQATARIATLTKQHRGSSAELRNLQTQLDATRNDLAVTRRQLDAMVGPALADGGYSGVLYAADDADSPPRIAMFVIDDSKGNVLQDKGWRVLEVAPDVTVRLTTPPGGPATKDFGPFVELWSLGYPEFAYLHAMVYSITVSDGLVTKIVETGERTWGG
jgi:hypothetical protein